MNVSEDMANEGQRAARRPALKEYRLIYLAGEDGIGKRVEFSAPNLEDAVARTLHDAMGRVVQVWENGEFVHTVYPAKHS